MAIPFLNHLDLRSVSELQNAILHKTTENSASDVEGKIIYDTGTDTIKFYDGTQWVSLGGDTNTFRTVEVDTNGNDSANNTLEPTETLRFKKGTNIELAEASGVITISSTDTNTQRAAGVGLTLNSNALDVNVGATGTTQAPESISNTANRLYQIETDDQDNLVVNVPWSDTDTNTQRAAGTGLSLDSNTINANVDSTVQTVAGSNVSATTGRTYKVQVDNSDNLVVNVPWSDTDTDTIDMGDGFTVTADTNTNATVITEGETLTIAGGTGISTQTTADGTVTITSSVSNTDVDVSVGNLEARLGEIDSNVSIGDSSAPTVTIPGNLVVQGTTTTVESTVTTFTDPIIELNKVASGGTQADPTTSSGIEVKRQSGNDVQLVWMEDSDDWEFEAYNHAGTPVKKKYKIPTSYKATIGDTNASAGSYSEAITHNLGTKHVIVQCYDTSTFETVYADVVRTSNNVVTLTFASAPTDNDVTVLILSAQGEQ
jgi:hypothetical protein